jgi:acetyl-CoA acyltransferase
VLTMRVLVSVVVAWVVVPAVSDSDEQESDPPASRQATRTETLRRGTGSSLSPYTELVAAWASEALILDAVRSPIGKKNGTLSSIRGDELAAQVLNALLARSDVDSGQVEDVQMGCVTQIGEQGWNIGRMVPMVGGWPETVAGTTVDRQCGSSMQTNFNAATAIWSGQLDLVVSAGVEMMSRVPMGSNGGDLSDKLLERWQIVPQGMSAEAIAEEWNLSREELDAFSLESHRRAIEAIDEGRFENEIVPVEVQNPHVGTLFAIDETPRRETSAEALAGLKPAFLPEGKVTAGNSSQICDGAAGVLIASGRKASELGVKPRARFVSFGLSGVDPYRMLHGNPQACDRALERAGIGWDDVSVIEVNEAFASVVLQFARDAGLEDRMDDVNPNGGGISLGHPLGATGARITATLLNELERRDARYGVATMCIGFGQAIAGVIERL